MRLHSEPIVGGSHICQGKNQPIEVSFVQSQDDPFEIESPPRTTEGSSTYTREIYNDPLMRYQEIPVRRPMQPPVCFMHKWALTTQVEDDLEPLMVTEASRSVHWRKAMEREYKSFVHNNTWNSFLYPRTRPLLAVSGVIELKLTRGERSSNTRQDTWHEVSRSARE